MGHHLEDKEIDILLKAIDALEVRASRDGLLAGVVGAMLSQNKEEAQTHLENARMECEVKDPQQKEALILLRAKLIGMRS